MKLIKLEQKAFNTIKFTSDNKMDIFPKNSNIIFHLSLEKLKWILEPESNQN